MGKHKKKLREEKSKTKFKGSKLPKGLNVTKTEFKVKKIVIREQLKVANPDEIQSSRNLNIKECVTRLNHHNSSFRTEALRGLKEIVSKYLEEVVLQYLGQVIQNLVKLALDVERQIRRESFKILDIILAGAPKDYIQPYFEILSSYTRCAMTHIQVPIQEDSLLLLDVLITHTPELISFNRDKLFSSFMDMMSKFRTESKPERTVTVNLGNKQTSVKWRSKILERLHKMLEAIIKEKFNSKQIVQKNIKNVEEVPIADIFTIEENINQNTTISKDNINYFQLNQPNSFPIIRSHFNQNSVLRKLFNKSQNLNLINEQDEEAKLKHYITILMPLLFETWLEVRPSSTPSMATVKSSKFQTVVSNEAALTLKIILEIMQQLLALVSLWEKEVNSNELNEWFKKTFSSTFTLNFIKDFYYVQCDVKRGNSEKKKKDTITERDVQLAGGVNCLQQNLSICFIFCALNQNVKGNNIEDFNTIIEYVDRCLQDWEFTTSELSNSFIQTLKVILYDNGNNWNKLKTNLTELLKTLIKTYKTKKLSKICQEKLLILLCDIVLNDKLLKFYGNENFTEWISDLPLMLCKPMISSHTIDTFSFLGKQSNKIFLENLSKDATEILRNISDIKVSGSENSFEGKKLILNLFFWLGKDLSKDISKQFNKMEIDKEVEMYLKEIISYQK